MNVGILGSGDVGQALGTGFAKHGYAVTIGSRTAGSRKLQKWARAAGRKAKVGTYADAADADLLVVACLGSAVDEVIAAAGSESFDGKVVIDVTNPLDFNDGSPGLFVGLTDSLGERIQRLLPKAKVVKCFNTVPSTLMVNPKLLGRRAEMLICGNDKRAKSRVTAVLKEFGWSGSIDVGGIDGARWLEALVPLWVRVSHAVGTWDQCFQVVRA